MQVHTFKSQAATLTRLLRDYGYYVQHDDEENARRIAREIAYCQGELERQHRPVIDSLSKLVQESGNIDATLGQGPGSPLPTDNPPT